MGVRDSRRSQRDGSPFIFECERNSESSLLLSNCTATHKKFLHKLEHHTTKNNKGYKRWQLRLSWLTLFVVVSALITDEVSAGNVRQQVISLGEKQKVRVCPKAREISPCVCSEMSKGKSHLCS